jgi:hypothetical protein
MTETPAPRIDHILDAEGEGVCSECGRENLRWLVVFTDNVATGTECTKKRLGWAPTRKALDAFAGAVLVESFTGRHQSHAWYTRPNGSAMLTVDGRVQTIGGPVAIKRDFDREVTFG